MIYPQGKQVLITLPDIIRKLFNYFKHRTKSQLKQYLHFTSDNKNNATVPLSTNNYRNSYKNMEHKISKITKLDMLVTLILSVCPSVCVHDNLKNNG